MLEKREVYRILQLMFHKFQIRSQIKLWDQVSKLILVFSNPIRKHIISNQI